MNAFDIRSMKHVGLPRVVFVPNISEYDLLIIAQVSRIKQVLEAEKIKPQEPLAEDFMVEKEILFSGVGIYIYNIFFVGGGLGTLTYNTNISESYIYAGMIHSNTHIVI